MMNFTNPIFAFNKQKSYQSYLSPQPSAKKRHRLLFVFLLFLFSTIRAFADCTAPTGTYTWASYLAGAGSGCTGTLIIPAGTSITLGSTSSAEIVNIPSSINRIIIQSGGNINFTGKGQLRLAVNTSISIQQTSPTSGSNAAINGDCNNNNEIWIGNIQYSVCAGGNACVTFSTLISSGGTTLIDPTVTVNGGSGNTVCFNNFGLNTTLSGYIGGTPSYSWTQTAGPGTSSFSPGNNVAGPSVTVSVPGTYTYKITVTSPLSATCSSTISTSSSSVTVVVRPTPIATITGSATVCQDTPSQVITFNNPQDIAIQVAYSLNGISQTPVSVGAGSSATVAASTATAGSFIYSLNSVQYQTQPFCTNSISGSASLTVNGITPGTISKGEVSQGPSCSPLDPDQTLAPTSATAATGSAATLTYLWQQSIDGGPWENAAIVSPETSNTDAQFNPEQLTSTTRIRRIATSTVNGVSCSAISNELEYVVYPIPVVPAITPSGTLNICEGSTIQLANSTDGGVWNSSGSNISISPTGLVTGISATPPSVSPNVSYTVTSGDGCTKTVNRTVNVTALPVITSASSVCVGNVFNLTPNSEGSWTSNNTTVATVSSTGLVTGVAQGSATFTFTSSSEPGCATTTSEVSVIDKPTASITSTSTSVCSGVTTDITGTVTATGNWTLTLSDGATANGTGNGSFTIPVTPVTNTIYTITSLLDANCSAVVTDLTGSTEVNVKPIPAAPSITVVDNCDGTSTLTASDYMGTLLWSNAETTPTISVTTAGSYSVTQTVDGCVSPLASATAAPKTTPAEPTVTSPREFCKDEVVSALTATGTDLLWYENVAGGIGNSTATIPQTSVVGTTNYYVTQTINGCESERAVITVIIKGDCPPMPVTLSAFKVKKQEQSVLISWKTTSETNSDRFEVERSASTKNGFTKIATVTSDDSNTGASYRFVDADILPFETIYYRLKMVDQDETFTYSNIQSVRTDLVPIVEIYPNPASDFINLETYNWKNVQSVKIRNSNGTEILHFTGTQLSSKLDVSKLLSATYLLEIMRTDGKTDYKRFVIIR